MDDITHNTELGAIIARSKEGDERAFRELFDLIVDRVYHYALARVKNTDAADDITQALFIDLWQALPRFTYNTNEAFMGFVFTIAKRKVWRHRLMHRNEVPLDEETIGVYYQMAPEDYRYLEKHIGALPKKYQEIIRLRYWSELSFKEIAASLAISEENAKVRHHRAIKQLQTLIDATYQYA
jgi:RNA polymerase sigma-70 factor (ECF subfamily)